LLALSTSSPFWQGEDTGLASYRLTVFDNMPRTGLPPRFDGWGEFRRSVDLLTSLDVIEDASKIWWDLRPSHGFPTLETRICDVPPRLEDTLALAALIQATLRMLWRLSRRNQRWRVYDRFLVAENRWRAQRYGVGANGEGGLIDFGEKRIRPMGDLIEEWLELLAEDGDALGSHRELRHARTIARCGTSADRQRAVLGAAHADGTDEEGAMRAVVSHLAEEFREGL
jgi:carboxylate-amine ligase